MNFQQLEYIVALDKFKSFSKAAEVCFITQATLSIMVKKLEDELGMVLFDRKTTPILTTECGQEIIREAQVLLLHRERLMQIPAMAKGNIEGQIKLGIIPTVAGNLIHRILPVILKKYPKLELHLTEIPTEGIIQQLKSGLLDAGIVSTPLSNSGLEEEILYYEKLMVYTHKTSQTTSYSAPKELANEKIWLLEEGNCLTDQVKKVCSLNPKKSYGNLHFSPGSFDSLLNLVDSMNGITIIPELYYMDLPTGRKKNVHDFKSPYPVREISLVYHRPYAKLRIVEALSKEIKTIIRPILASDALKNREMNIAKMGTNSK